MSRLALGMAQFGMNYGIANQRGRVGLAECREILDVARSNGIDLLDTAVSYGHSEANLGSIGVQGWRIVTKLPRHPDNSADVARWVREQVMGSLKRLGIPCLYGLLLHEPDQLLEKTGPLLYGALCQLKADQLVDKIGISIYGPEELEALCAEYAFDLIQAPLSVLDHRMIDSGWLARLNGLDIELHVRSVFLQGLLLMPSKARPLRFARWQSIWRAWDAWLSEHDLTPLQACVRYVLSLSEISQVVVGVDNPSQLRQIIAEVAGNGLPDLPAALQTNDADLLNPARWATS